MKIQLVSFPKYQRLTVNERINRMDAISQILSVTTADFVMFSEHILKSEDDLFALLKFRKIRKDLTALFELKVGGNQLYLLENGFVRKLSSQIFATSEDANTSNLEFLITELKRFRQFEVKGKRFLIIQCGENNFLKGSSGCAEFRLKKEEPELCHRYEKLLSEVDIILNPVHNRWGRFGNFLARMRKFSNGNRYSFSCTQMEGNQLEKARINPTQNTTHIAMHNLQMIAPTYTNSEEPYLIQTYVIV